ncbi:uncharacterized protein [Rutidosis leptorrhynchoides]|uniref:uncharacterized protein n=1 Tax=Rutidosis leptorrhynchoides TaxID=125765 RepID=UPI003A9A5C01
MCKVVKKLRALKKPIRKLMWNKGNLHANVIQLRSELDTIQLQLDSNLFSSEIRDLEIKKLKEYSDALWDEERFLKQKAKIEWLRVGDSNSNYFHKVVKARNNRLRINAVTNSEGVLVEGNEVVEVFVSHYMDFLGDSKQCMRIVTTDLFQSKITHEMALDMIKVVSDDEIKDAMFNIGDDKESGPDGYTSTFFKKACNIVGNEVCMAVKDFFLNGQLLTEINHTILTLLPKVESPSKVNDYRPISFCNVIYKCISKIITSRITSALDAIISSNQSAFVPGRRIMDNILITQEIMKNYHLNRDGFMYHPKCERQEIVNVCFADDLFIFARANRELIQTIATALDEFKKCSGASKCLGVPLISTRLYQKDFKGLIDSMRMKIDDWKNKFLSFTRRVQLIKSVLSSMQVYWSSVFILPDSVIKDMEKIMRGFLWCQGEMKKGKSKVKWSGVCLPKEEGGLGIKSLKTWNIALMAYHIWSIITHKKSLWVKWIHTYRLNHRNFWVVDTVASSSWAWWKILSIREDIRHLFVHVVGNGDDTSAWYDTWTDFGPLADVISSRDMHSANLHDRSKVSDFLDHMGWNWPTQWTIKFPMLLNVPIPNRDESDKLFWKTHDGSLVEFSTKQAWESIHPHASKVWFGLLMRSRVIPLLLGYLLKRS